MPRSLPFILLTLLLLTPACQPDSQPATQAASRPAPVAFDIHVGHYVSNKFEPEKSESFVVIQDQETFDQTFGTALVQGKVANYLPAEAFQTKIVLAAIKRGHAIWTFNVTDVTTAGGVLTFRYTATSEKTDTADYASPVIISVPKGNYTAVLFEENATPVANIPLKTPATP